VSAAISHLHLRFLAAPETAIKRVVLVGCPRERWRCLTIISIIIASGCGSKRSEVPTRAYVVLHQTGGTKEMSQKGRQEMSRVQKPVVSHVLYEIPLHTGEKNSFVLRPPEFQHV
jgi:hypothetical protein